MPDFLFVLAPAAVLAVFAAAVVTALCSRHEERKTGPVGSGKKQDRHRLKKAADL